MEKLPKHDGGRAPTSSASSNSADLIPPTRQTASEPSNVGRATTDPTAHTTIAVAGRSRRRRNKLSSTSSSISQAHIAVPPEHSKCSSSSSRTSSSRSEAAQPVALSHGGPLSTTASASSRPEYEPMSSKNVHQATSRSGRPYTDGLAREDREARRRQASSVEGSRPLPATLERASHESRPAETNAECSAEKSNQPGTNHSEPRYREPPVGMELSTNAGAPPPSMAQLQHSTTNRDWILETGSFVHRPDTVVPGPSVAPKKNRRSLSAASIKRKLQTAFRPRTSATGLTPIIQDLLELKRPSLEKQSPWRSRHAFLVERALQHRRLLVSVVLLCTASGSLLLGLLMARIFGRDDPSAVMCGNYDCVDHVAALSLTHNDDIAGPCKNFAQFVCSGIKNKYSSLAESVVSQRVLDYTAKIIMQRVNNSIFSRPSKMIRRCLDENSRDDATLKAVVEFLRDKSFAWPTPNETKAFPDADTANYSHPLNILLDLAVTWSVPIWFRCDLLLLHEGSDRAVRLAPSPMGRVAKQYHELVLGYSSYASYVEFVASILFSLRELYTCVRFFCPAQ
ncbi:hypothetical protein HPB49_016844 [Dermacentor silvarum]|uniref:Uncharacterized protein n=1 Tax=Dermacentor silvarum TaxID=543639 RepID=A0ACB8CLX6_DERSI|nr:hypothetical protein HPB49_016844 [Dermacentor silvarum]